MEGSANLTFQTVAHHRPLADLLAHRNPKLAGHGLTGVTIGQYAHRQMMGATSFTLAMDCRKGPMVAEAMPPRKGHKQ